MENENLASNSKVLKWAYPVIVVVLIGLLIYPLFKGESPVRMGLDLSGGVIVSYLPDFSRTLNSYQDKSKEDVLEMSKEIITERLLRKLNQAPEVYVSGDQKLIVSIPDVDDYQQVLKIVGQTYFLTFRLVKDFHDQNDSSKNYYPYAGKYVELASPLFSGDMIDLNSIQVLDPEPGTGDPDLNFPRVGFSFNSPYAQEFAKFTKGNIGKPLAILLDDNIEVVATIQDEISEGKIALSGEYSFDEAKRDAMLLKSGSLPVSLKIEGLSKVGPSLGQTVREKGVIAFLISILLLLILLLLAYSHRSWFLISGTLSLIFLLLMIASLVSGLKLTLDFAAIAGLILSIGMGMDAFIIIFESLELQLIKFDKHEIARHFEEIVKEIYSFRKEGRILLHSIITTFIVIFFLVFSDRIKYFALFMVAGLIASVLTIIFTRKLLLSTYGLAPDLGKSLLGFLRRKKLGVFSVRKPYYVLTGIAGAFFLYILFGTYLGKGHLRLGSDFREGTQIVGETKEAENILKLQDEFRTSFPEVGFKYQQLNHGQEVKGNKQFLITISAPLSSDFSGAPAADSTEIRKGETDSEFSPFGGSSGDIAQGGSESSGKPFTTEALVDLFGFSSVNPVSITSIDNKISSDRFFYSFLFLGASFFVLVIYLFGFQASIDRYFFRRIATSNNKIISGNYLIIAFGIIIALMHDLCYVAIACYLLDIEINLPEIAGILTIIGYSVNDSVVVWGQIQKIHMIQGVKKDLSPLEVISRAIDSIISRAFLTSLSTIIPAIAILAINIPELTSFAWIILIGTVAGTFSSIFIVGSFAYQSMKQTKEKEQVKGETSVATVWQPNLSKEDIRKRMDD